MPSLNELKIIALEAELQRAEGKLRNALIDNADLERRLKKCGRDNEIRRTKIETLMLADINTYLGDHEQIPAQWRKAI